MIGNGCKVCRVLDERDMGGYDERLAERWRAEGPNRMGYRALATWLNTTMLRREMDAAGLSTLGDEAESRYERLTTEDETVASEVRSTFRTEGVPIDDLVDDFVSYGVVRTHLLECLDLDRPEQSPSDWEKDALSITRQHAESKASEAVTSLVNKGAIRAAGSIDVSVSIELECTETHQKVPLERALRRGYVSRPEATAASPDAGGQSSAEPSVSGGDGT